MAFETAEIIEKVGHDAESALGLFERIFCHVEKILYFCDKNMKHNAI